MERTRARAGGLHHGALFAALALACTGEVGESGGDPPGAPSSPVAPRPAGTPGGGAPSTGQPPATSTPGAPPTTPAPTPVDPPSATPPALPADGAAGAARRLTFEQYWNTIEDLFGPGLPRLVLEQDLEASGFSSVGASHIATSNRGVEQYEAAALDIARRVFADAQRRMTVTGCTPARATDEACMRTLVTRLGRMAFRRPLTDVELARLTKLGVDAATALEDFWGGAQHAAAAILQSPKFLYRVEIGQPVPGAPGTRRLGSHELAGRLSFLLWNTTPDAALLDAADRDALATPAGIRTQATRLLESPRAARGVRQFFAELLRIVEPNPVQIPDVAQAMQQETLLLAEAIVLKKKTDALTLLTSPTTFLNRVNAPHYGLKETYPKEFIEGMLPAGGPRAGFFGHGSFLMASSKKDHTSPTARGKFVREVLLCAPVPAPPPGVVTELPELPPGTAATARQRLTKHATDPSCAGCHALMDPIGFVFERFDWQGKYRETESGLPIDTAAELDGQKIADARGLAQALAGRKDVAACLARNVFRHAVGHVETAAEAPALDALIDRFQMGGRRLDTFLVELAASDVFRTAITPSTAGAAP